MAAACLCCKTHVGCCACFYTHGHFEWAKSLRAFPRVCLETISKWLESGGKKNAGEKSYKFFREGYVFDVYAAASSLGESFVKARCYRSLRKNEEPHYLVVKMKKEEHAEVAKAHCSCKGGSGGHCNHVFALLFLLNDYACLDVKDIPSDATCTSKPQSWHIPRAPSICPMPVMGTHYARAETDRQEKRSRDPVTCKLYEARGPRLRQVVQLYDINDLKRVPSLEFEPSRDFFLSKICLDLIEAHSLEKNTVLQGESKEWLEQHKLRLTASSFGKVFHRVQRPSEAMVKSFFTTKDLTKIKAIAHGKAKEKVARSIYARNMQKKSKHFTVFDAGLCVHPSLPYLGASPDGKIYDPLADPCYGLLEIKCPFTKRGDTLEQATADPNFYLEKVGESVHLNKGHSCGYYAQAQGQMALTGMQWCDFCVYLSDSNEMLVERIPFDNLYWSTQLLPKLKEFYFEHALKYLTQRSLAAD